MYVHVKICLCLVLNLKLIIILRIIKFAAPGFSYILLVINLLCM